MNFKKILFILNIIGIIALLGILMLIYLWEEYLNFFNLNQHLGQLIIMFLISSLLLLTAFQSNLNISWRIFSSIASLLIMIEMILMCKWWRIIF